MEIDFAQNLIKQQRRMFLHKLNLRLSPSLTWIFICSIALNLKLKKENERTSFINRSSCHDI